LTVQILLALLSWPVVTLALFAVFGPARGLLASCIAGYLLLPNVAIVIADGLPAIDKNGVVAGSCLLAALTLAPGPISRFRPHWLDLLPALGFVVWGVSSLVNGLGIKDALLEWWDFATMALTVYLLGRVYLRDLRSLRDLAFMLVAGAMVYAPLAVVEMRMSPRINTWVYGFDYGAFYELRRNLEFVGISIGGFRPRVMLPAGLALAIWMAAGTAMAWALLLGGFRDRILKVPLGLTAGVLLVITILCRGTGASVLMLTGIAALCLTRWSGWKRVTLWLPAFVGLYISTALLGEFLPIREVLVDLSGDLFGSVRQGSLDFRLRHEGALVSRAMEAPLFGWGGWDRNRVNIEVATELLGKASVTDGFWIIALGKKGLLGLLGTYGWMILPASLAVLAVARARTSPQLLFLVLGLAAWSYLLALDQLFNGFVNPAQALVAAALTSFVAAASHPQASRPPAVNSAPVDPLRAGRLRRPLDHPTPYASGSIPSARRS